MPTMTLTSGIYQEMEMGLVPGVHSPGAMAAPGRHVGPILGDHIGLKLLVICPQEGDPNLVAIQNVLESIGVPYDMLAMNVQRLTPTLLWSGREAHYQGIVLIGGSPAQRQDASSQAKNATNLKGWRYLERFRARFGVRQVTLLLHPEDGPDAGLQIDEFVDTYTTPLELALTDAGRGIFWYLNPSVAIPITSVAAYTAHPIDADPMASPLLVTAQGQTLAAIQPHNGCEQLVLTMAQGSGLLHTMLLGYGLVNWVTRGLFLGQRRMYLGVQVDDIFNSNQLWDAEHNTAHGDVFRLGSRDVQAMADWLQRLHQENSNWSSFTLDLAFNGAGAALALADDGLVQSLMDQQAKFRWINHGYTHLLLDDASAEQSLNEIRPSHDMARRLGFGAYDVESMVTSDMSGLDNGEFLGAAFEAGVRYLVSDTSRPGGNNLSFNVGNPSVHQPDILIIPRHPNNLFYDVSTPDQWVSQYNHIYHHYWKRDLTYGEILDVEATVLLRYVVAFDIDPLMFHQANLRAYDGTHSLLSDLIDRVVRKYDLLFGDVPIVSLSMREIGQTMKDRAAYDAAEVEARLIVGTGLMITADRDVTVPITGVRVDETADFYAGQYTSSIPVKAHRRWLIPVAALQGFEPL